MVRTLATLSALAAVALAAPLDPTPPMGWMSWEIFRCDVDCDSSPDKCINEQLYKVMTDQLTTGGYAAAGYDSIHIDDCWMAKHPSRTDGKLVANATRFPSGMKALGDYMHAQKIRFALYTAESTETCGGYPASKGYEEVDADTFASWGVDYLKVDGCGQASYYPTGYPAMGKALQQSGRAITYSCSWPAYLGSNETTKPYDAMITAGCNLWRNWDDIQCNWGSLSSIIDHWGDYGPTLAKYAAPGHFNDPDMLLIGNPCINIEQARTQMAMWSIFAAPLIMGNDLRTVPDDHRNVLLNKEAIAVDQDPMGKQGLRITPKGAQEVWARQLANGDMAVGLYNKEGAPAPSPKPVACPLPSWNHTTGGYLEACGGAAGNLGSFNGLTVAQAQQACCSNDMCAGFDINSSGSGYYKKNSQCGFVNNKDYDGYYKPSFPSPGGPANITVSFSDIGMSSSVHVRDIWAQKDLGTFTTSFTAQVAQFDTAFYRFSKA